MRSRTRSSFPTRNIAALRHRCAPAWKSNPASRSSKTHQTRHGRHRLVVLRVAIVLLLLPSLTNAQSASESTLASVRRSDASSRDANGNLPKLSPAEHMRRAAVYLSVRAFAEARAHWQTLIDNYPQDPRVAEALLGIGRSYFLSKIYQDGYVVFNRLAQEYAGTKEGREALNFSAASLLRMGKFSEAAARYAEY